MSACEGKTLRIADSLAQPCLEEFVNGCVDATDKETSDARDFGGVAAACDQIVQAPQIRLDNVLVDLLRKE